MALFDLENKKKIWTHAREPTTDAARKWTPRYPILRWCWCEYSLRIIKYWKILRHCFMYVSREMCALLYLLIHNCLLLMAPYAPDRPLNWPASAYQPNNASIHTMYMNFILIQRFHTNGMLYLSFGLKAMHACAGWSFISRKWWSTAGLIWRPITQSGRGKRSYERASGGARHAKMNEFKMWIERLWCILIAYIKCIWRALAVACSRLEACACAGY